MERPVWRMIKTEALSGAMNMALDEVFLESVQAGISPPVVRLYRWQPKTVSLGYTQRGSAQVNTAYCAAQGIDIVRRLTGGRAVLHDQEVTYSVISRQQGLFSNALLGNYQTISNVLLHCLTQIGLDARLVGRQAGATGMTAVEKSACFTAPAQFEIVCQGKKACGSSQRRVQESFLQHGSIPLDIALHKLFYALTTDTATSASQGVARLSEKVGWVNRFIQRPRTVDEVEEQLRASFRSLWPVQFVIDEPSSAEMKQASRLVQEKYSRVDWHLAECD